MVQNDKMPFFFPNRMTFETTHTTNKAILYQCQFTLMLKVYVKNLRIDVRNYKQTVVKLDTIV